MAKQTAFISGHLDITPDEFKQHYIPIIDSAISKGWNFVVGSARGADRMSLEYLIDQKISLDRITVYATSDIAIAYRAGRISGTQKNINRRAAKV